MEHSELCEFFLEEKDNKQNRKSSTEEKDKQNSFLEQNNTSPGNDVQSKVYDNISQDEDEDKQNDINYIIQMRRGDTIHNIIKKIKQKKVKNYNSNTKENKNKQIKCELKCSYENCELFNKLPQTKKQLEKRERYNLVESDSSESDNDRSSLLLEYLKNNPGNDKSLLCRDNFLTGSCQKANCKFRHLNEEPQQNIISNDTSNSNDAGSDSRKYEEDRNSNRSFQIEDQHNSLFADYNALSHPADYMGPSEPKRRQISDEIVAPSCSSFPVLANEARIVLESEIALLRKKMEELEKKVSDLQTKGFLDAQPRVSNNQTATMTAVTIMNTNSEITVKIKSTVANSDASANN